MMKRKKRVTNMKLGKAIDKIFSHNNIIAIYKDNSTDHESVMIWRGEAWRMPPMYMHATKCGAYKISFSDHSRSMKNVVHCLQSMQNRSIKSKFVSPFAPNKINNSVQWRV